MKSIGRQGEDGKLRGFPTLSRNIVFAVVAAMIPTPENVCDCAPGCSVGESVRFQSL